MLQNILQNISFISTLLGNFFLFSSIIGFMRYKDFYIKLHTVSMFNIYGINFILFAIASNSYDPIIFFEMLIVIIVNTLCTLCAIHCFLRNAILNGIEYVAKTRDDVIKEKTNKLKEQILKEKISNTQQEERARERERIIEQRRIEKEKKEEEKRIEKQRKKEAKELEKIRKQEIKKQKEEEIKNSKKENNQKIETKAAKTTTATVSSQQDKPQNVATVPQPAPAENNNQTSAKPSVNNDDNMSEEEKKIKAENDDLKAKIKEQKKILRKKIETARKKAFITRKPEEIEKTEKMIQDILNKYNLTEDMLKEDDD